MVTVFAQIVYVSTCSIACYLLITISLTCVLVDSGDVLEQDKFKGLTCAQCGAAHRLTSKANSSAVPLDHAVMASLQRLQGAGAVGGLLPSDALELQGDKMGNATYSAVYSGVLKMHHQQVQVWYAFTLQTLIVQAAR